MASQAKRKDATTTNTARPLMPRLAASAQAPRSSPAPKLAGYNTPSPQTRRPPMTTTPSISATKSSSGDRITPVTNFVNSNITPRSSSRKSRADSSQSTPTNDANMTPSIPSHLSTVATDSPSRKPGLGFVERSESDLNRLRTQHTSVQSKHQSLPTSPNLTQSPERIGGSSTVLDNTGFFFYAGNRPTQDKQPSKPQHKKTASFVYANGISELKESRSRMDTNDDLIPFHTRASAPEKQNLLNGKPRSPQLGASAAPSGTRQPSPPRLGFHLTYRKGASQVIPPQPISPPPSNVDMSMAQEWSIDGDENQRQSRTISMSSAGSAQVEQPARKETGFPFLSMFSLPSSKNSPMVSPTADGSGGSIFKRDSIQLPNDVPERTQSPFSAVCSSEGNTSRSEAAAHARRERKIMDLEISNSSLLVINRSLEKEVRRQKTELRRYKRLSRASSLLPNNTSRLSLERLSLLTEDEDVDAKLEDEVEDDEGEDDDDDESSDSFAEESMSPGAITQHDARHRKSDQRRLQQDLAKHKELLADSQRMNQSLKKCLSVTEQLIAEGNRALEYKVHHDDIQIGGRVLSPEEQGGEFSSSRAPTPFYESERSSGCPSMGDTAPFIPSSPYLIVNGDPLNPDSNERIQGPAMSQKSFRQLPSDVLGETF